MGSNIALNNLDEYLQFNDCMERVKFLTSIEIPPSLIGTRAYSDLVRLVSMSMAIYEEYALDYRKINIVHEMITHTDFVKTMYSLDQTRELSK